MHTVHDLNIFVPLYLDKSVKMLILTVKFSNMYDLKLALLLKIQKNPIFNGQFLVISLYEKTRISFSITW